MRIAICTDCYIPEVNGVVYHINTLYEGLKEAGHEVLIIKPDYKVKKHTIENDVLNSPAIKIKKLYDYSFGFSKSPKRLKILKEWKPDIIHIHTEYSQGHFGLYAAKHLKVPVVYTIHTMYYDYLHYFGKLQNWKITKNFVDHMLLKFINTSEAIICASRKMDKFIKSLTSEKPIHVIPNTCIVKDFAYEKLDKDLFEKLKRENEIDSENLNVCFCGRLAAEKNLKKMFEIWKEILADIPKAKLIIIGDGPQKSELEETSIKMGLNDNILFTGKIDHNLIQYYYHMCDAYFMVSTSENHSISALEATACTLPIIHLYDEANEYQYVEGLTGFAFKNIDGLKEIFYKMCELKKSKGAMEDFKAKLLKKAQEGDYRHATKEIVEIYNKAITTYKNK